MFFPLEGNRYFIAWELEFLFSRWMQLSCKVVRYLYVR